MDRFLTRRTLLGAGGFALLAPLLSACDDMPDMIMPTGDGTVAQAGDMTFHPVSTTTPPAGQPVDFAFQILKDRKPFTDFVEDMTKKMHFYAVCSDLTGYQHLHPQMDADGTWRVQLAALHPGTWRFYATFVGNSGGNHTDYVLGQEVSVAGDMAPMQLPPPSASVQTDGYTLTFNDAKFTDDMYKTQKLEVTIAKDGMPVMDLENYLGAKGHLTAIRSGDMQFVHIHPEGMDMGGGQSKGGMMLRGLAGDPTLTFDTMFPKDGDWRLFLQFQTMGMLHLAEFTLHVTAK